MPLCQSNVHSGAHKHTAYKCLTGLCTKVFRHGCIQIKQEGHGQLWKVTAFPILSGWPRSQRVAGRPWTESPLAIWPCRSPLWANTRRVALWHILMVRCNIGGSCKLRISPLHIHPFHLTTPPTWPWFPFTCSRWKFSRGGSVSVYILLCNYRKHLILCQCIP